MPIQNTVQVLNGSNNMKKIIKNWIIDTKKYLKDNWFDKEELNEIIGSQKILDAYKYLLECLSEVISDENLRIISKKNIKKFKGSNSDQHLLSNISGGLRQNLRPKIFIPIHDFIDRMRSWNMINKQINRPIANQTILKYHDISIILHYKNKAIGVLEYYKPATNFHWLKKQVDYHMRLSLLFTLARKHRKTLSKIVSIIGKNASIYISTSNNNLEEIASFPSSSVIRNYKSKFTSIYDPIDNLKLLRKPFTRISLPKIFYKECQVKECKNTDIKVHHLRSLSRNIAVRSMKSDLGRKQMPLCRKHDLDARNGKLTHTDIKDNPQTTQLLNDKQILIRF